MIIIIFIIFIAFFVKGAFFLDPDFGWHLKMGQLILHQGIPATDPFSYTMPSFPFIDHEWLTNVIIALLYPTIGMYGLAIIAAFLTVAAVYMQIGRNWYRWTPCLFLLTSTTLISFTGVRPQIISWFFLSLLFTIVFNKKTRWRFTLPLLFLLWTNLHGGFAMGIAALLVVIIARFFEQKKVNVADIFVFLCCIAATFVNPYKARVWEEIWRSISDQNLRGSIQEWTPTIFVADFSTWILIPFSFISLFRYKNRFSLPQLSVWLTLLIAGLSSIRHFPLWTVINLAMQNSNFLYFQKEASLHKYGKKRFATATSGFFAGVGFLFFVYICLMLRLLLINDAPYPASAVRYLKNNLPASQIFSVYRWGGYLIWKLPEKKVFIDGRMPSWKWESAPHGESNNAFLEYNKMLSGKIPMKHIIDKYHIDTLLFPVDLAKQFKSAGIKEVYRDSVAVIYFAP